MTTPSIEDLRRRLPGWIPNADDMARHWTRAEALAVAVVRRHHLLLVALVIAAVLRFARWSAPLYYGDDAEYTIVAGYLAQDPFYLAYPQIEGFGPHPFVSQPPLLLYLFALGGTITEDLALGAVLVSAVLGTATVAVVYAIGNWVHGRWAAAPAAFLVALAPLHVELSRKAFLDAGLTFFFTATIWLFLRWSQRPTRGRALAVGIGAACTALSKLPGILVYPALLVPVIWLLARVRFADQDDPPPIPIQSRELVVHGGLAALPGIVGAFLYLALLAFLQGLVDLRDKLGWQYTRVAGPVDAQSSRPAVPWHAYLSSPQFGLPEQFGIAFFAIAVWGAIHLISHGRNEPARKAGLWAVVLWPAVVFLFFTIGGRREGFYILPVVPALAVLGSVTLARAAKVLRSFVDERSKPSTRGAVQIAALSIIASFLVSPAIASSQEVAPARPYGHGVREAAWWIHGQDPHAAQVGTLLGRFTLHFYNGQPTYHFFLNQTFIDQEAAAGRLRYIVYDDYLNLTHERAWMKDLILRHSATPVQRLAVEEDRVRVIVYEIPASRTPPT